MSKDNMLSAVEKRLEICRKEISLLENFKHFLSVYEEDPYYLEDVWRLLSDYQDSCHTKRMNTEFLSVYLSDLCIHFRKDERETRIKQIFRKYFE